MASVVTDRVAANIRAEMARRRVFQWDLAQVIGFTNKNSGQVAMSRRLSGAVQFRADELAAIAEFLGVSVADLYADAA